MTARRTRRRHPSQHSLRSVVMGGTIEMPLTRRARRRSQLRWKQGDRVVLASDGLLTLSEKKIADILEKTRDAPLEDSAVALIQAVEGAEHPYQDNVTVLLYAPIAD